MEKVVRSSFFFTTFLDEKKAKDMFEVFKEFGDIDEVFILARRDVKGRHYGFVRFFDVKYVRFLATKLDNIFLGAGRYFS